MIGPLEIIVVAIVLLVIFGYKKLPELGRSAGTGLRSGGEKAKELADSVGEKASGKVDPRSIGRSAGKGMREAREFRESFTGASGSRPADEPKGEGEGEGEARSEAPPAPAAPPAAPPAVEADGAESRRADSNR